VRWIVAATATLLLVPALALASVTATVDRRDIRINESFTLKVQIGGDLTGEPDLSVLEKDFDVLSENRTSSTTMVNRRVSRSRTWTVSLMAKRTGELTVPAFTVDGESSEPITVTVEDLEEAPPGEAEIFLVAEVDARETWVQAQVVYSVKIFVGVSSRQPRLVQPTFDGVEVLVQPFDDDRRYESVIGGRTYTVLERRYALFPQASGTLEIGRARFEARLLDQGMRTVRKVFTSDPVSVEVQPIPASPPGYPDAACLKAGSRNIRVHLDYMTYLLEGHSWLTGPRMTIADITAASHLSCLDYTGDVPWDDYPAVREWYAVMKSRPSFRGLLADHLPGFPQPPAHYADLDF